MSKKPQQNFSYYYSNGPTDGSPGGRSAGSNEPTSYRVPVGMNGDSKDVYSVQHLATFGMGEQSGIQLPSDGIRKLRQMERNSAIWAQPMLLRLRKDAIYVEDENGELVEKFTLHLITQPTAHVTNDSRDMYNNLLLFVVREDERNRTATGAEMHIFQCVRVSAHDVVRAISVFLDTHSGRQPVRNGRSDATKISPSMEPVTDYAPQPIRNYPPISVPPPDFTDRSFYPDDNTPIPERVDVFEKDVNTLNRCFDEIERFVARIQHAASAQRELETRQARKRSSASNGLLVARAQMPTDREFVDVLQKFKLSFNLLAKLRNHIHEPNAPELLHFLFTPLTVILDACRWTFGANIAPNVVSPLLSRDAKELMLNCLTSKESDVWLTLGDAWRIPEDEWPQALPYPYFPVFYDGYMPYGAPPNTTAVPREVPVVPTGLAVSGPNSRRGSVKNVPITLEFEKLSIEKERIELEKERLRDRERRIQDEEEKVLAEKQRLKAEKQRFYEEQEKGSERSYTSEPFNGGVEGDIFYNVRSRQVDERVFRKVRDEVPPAPNSQAPSRDEVDVPIERSPRQKQFLQNLLSTGAKAVQVMHDRVANNAKELTVTKGEFLEVMNDSKQWWECKNIHQRIGFVPNTIVHLVTQALVEPLFVNASHHTNGEKPSLHSPAGKGAQVGGGGPGMRGDDKVPDYVKQRQGKHGEFRYF